MDVSIIVAMTPERLIGAAGGLPWHLPEDLKRFRERTMGHAIIMGRRTFDSVGRPLKGRRNLVVSRNAQPPKAPGIEWFTTLDAALIAAEKAGETECFIAGGTGIYAAALAKATRMYITFVRRDPPFHGDTFFPAWDETQWQVTAREHAASGGAELEFVTYERTLTSNRFTRQATTMRFASILFLILGFLLIAIGRHLVRRARRLSPQSPVLGTRRLFGWTLTILGFLAVLVGVTLW